MTTPFNDAENDASVWEVALRPQDTGDPAWRGRLLERMRTTIEDRLRDDPAANAVQVSTALGTVEARTRRKPGGPPAPVRLAFAPGARNLPAPSGGSPDGHTGTPLPALRLPDEETKRLGERLVGLDGARRDLLLRWGCLWDDELEDWSARAARPLPRRSLPTCGRPTPCTSSAAIRAWARRPSPAWPPTTTAAGGASPA